MAHANAAKLASTPMNVEQLVSAADEPFFEIFFSTQNWFRTAQLMTKQANIYERQGDLQTAYFLLYRHARLILEFLPRHPEGSNPQYRQAWIDARRDVQRSLSKLEELKPRINRRYDEHQEKPKSLQGQERLVRQSARQGDDDWISRRVDPDEIARRALRKLNSKSEQSRVERDERDLGPAQRTPHQEDDSYDSVLEAGRRLQEPSGASDSSTWSQPARRTPSTFNYPTVPQKHQYAPSEFPRAEASTKPLTPIRAPTLPPKEPQPSVDTPPFSTSTPPLIPSKVHEVPSNRPASTPSPSADLAPFPTPAHTENHAPLRTLFLPSTLQTTFLNNSHQNTIRNLETCGMLVGTLMQNALFTTHLILPPQTGTPDTCEMTDESALQVCIESLEQKEGRDLLVLGWIHTHPRQTCFLSSADLHTHVWYQASLPESVAVVCAPEKGERRYGVFRLTDGPGLKVVRDCRREGTFHPHDCEGLYTDAGGWPEGHVIEQGGLEMSVVDLRGKRG